MNCTETVSVDSVRSEIFEGTPIIYDFNESHHVRQGPDGRLFAFVDARCKVLCKEHSNVVAGYIKRHLEHGDYDDKEFYSMVIYGESVKPCGCFDGRGVHLAEYGVVTSIG